MFRLNQNELNKLCMRLAYKNLAISNRRNAILRLALSQLQNARKNILKCFANSFVNTFLL